MRPGRAVRGDLLLFSSSYPGARKSDLLLPKTDLRTRRVVYVIPLGLTLAIREVEPISAANLVKYASGARSPGDKWLRR